VTQTTKITRQDRQLWERFRQIKGLNRPTEGTLPELDGEDATIVAAFIEGRLTTQEREAFERRLTCDPDLLERTVAARMASDAARAHDPEVPASLIAAARLATPAGAALPGPRQAPHSRRRTGFGGSLFGPLMAGSVAAAAFVAVTAAVLVWWSEDKPMQVVEVDQRKAIERENIGDERTGIAKDPAPVGIPAPEPGRNGNSIFTNPDKTYFDGLDVE